jgi:hypothetical protein
MDVLMKTKWDLDGELHKIYQSCISDDLQSKTCLLLPASSRDIPNYRIALEPFSASSLRRLLQAY